MKTAVLALGGSTTGPANNGVRYCALAGGGSASGWFANIANAKTPIAAPGTISDLIVNLPVALTAGQTWEFMVMLNGAPTALVVTIDSTGLVQADHVHSFAVAKGDTIALRSTPTSTPNAQTTLQASFVFEGSTAGESILFSVGGAGTVVNFMAPGCSSASNSTEVTRSGVMPCAGDISELYVVASAAPGGSTSRVITLRKNGVDTGLTATLTSALTAANATPTTVSFVAGDIISFGQTLPGGAPASASVQLSVNWKPTVDGQGLAFGLPSGIPSTSATVFINFRGASASNESVETNVLSIAPVAITIDQFQADISTAAGAAKHRVFKTRKTTGGVTSDAQTVDINGASAVTGTDGTDISLAAGDFIDVSTTPSGTPAAVTWARTSAIVTVDASPPGISFAPTDTSGIVWDGLRSGANTGSVTVQGDYTGAPTDVQVRLVDGSGTQVAAWASASSQGGGHYSHTFAGVPIGGPYYQRVRDNGGSATSSIAKQYVDTVGVAWGQSQCHRLGLVDLGGAVPVAGVTTYVSISVDTPAGVITARDVVANAAAIGSGIINIHNEFHTASGGTRALMIVMVAHQGVSIEQYIADADPNSEGWGLWTGLVTHILTFAKNQASAVWYFQGTSDVGAEATYAANMETLRGMFEAILGSAGPLKFLVAPHPRSNDGNKTWAMRNVQYAKAVSGSPWSLLCWVLDHEMDGDASPHQSANAAGNRRLGTRFGRGLTKALYNPALDILGPQITSATFTDLTRAAVEVTFDRAIQTPGAATIGLPGFCISTDDGATFTAPNTLTAAITAANKVVVTLGSAGVQNHTRLDYLRGVPYTSDSLLAAEYVGHENTIEAAYLAKTITDTTSFDSSRGMPMSPMMGTGVAVGEFSAGGAIIGDRVSLGLSFGFV